MTAAIQSGTIFASLLIWFKPVNRKYVYQLIFLAWLAVAVSINVPFAGAMIFIFCSFCILATALIILRTMTKPDDKRFTFLYYRHYIVFSFSLLMISTGLFFCISKAVVIFDNTFMNFISDYVMPNSYSNFLRINPRLQLVSPGRSAWDKRPAFEVSVPNVQEVYLKMQVFKSFNNGSWDEDEDLERTPLPVVLDKDLPKGEMTMFVSFERIVPSVSTITAAQGMVTFKENKEHIIFSEDKQRTRILEFSFDPQEPVVELSSDERAQYTSLPQSIALRLRGISSVIVGHENDAAEQAKRIKEFLINNFKYSLTVSFRADNDGIIEMLEKRRPAYCSYFATAMSLLVRAQGIPARVVTGFHTNERVGSRNIFLARVYDAHAWSEVLLPEADPGTGQISYRWKRFDPTPSGERMQILDTLGIRIARLTDRFWLAMLRFGAYMENMDKDKLKKNILFLFVGVLILMNRKEISRGLSQWIKNRRKKDHFSERRDDDVYSIYRQYEEFLKNAYGEVRKLTETDAEVLARLKQRSEIPPIAIAQVENFIAQYQAVRFGEKKNTPIALPKTEC